MRRLSIIRSRCRSSENCFFNRTISSKINRQAANARTQSSKPNCTQTNCKAPLTNSILFFFCIGSAHRSAAHSTHSSFSYFCALFSPNKNSIRPAAPTTLVSKFTLHSSSLPKPQTAVPISLAPRYAMDVKNAKQVANHSRKGFRAQREISADSGIDGSIGSSHSRHGFDTARKSPQPIRQRPRNLEMVFSERHKFHVRDLNDEVAAEENVVLLPLPKLPSAFDSSSQPANLR